MTQEKKFGTDEAMMSSGSGSLDSRLSYLSRSRKWKWIAQLSPLVIVLLVGAFWLGWWQGRGESEHIQQVLTDTSVEIMKTLRGGNNMPNQSDGLSQLWAIQHTLKNDIMMAGNDLLSHCRAEGQSNIMAIFEIAKQYCSPKSEEDFIQIIPRNVSRFYFILDGKTKSVAEVNWGSEKYLYEVSLERTSEEGSYAGVCWEFTEPIDLSAKKVLKIELWTNSVGRYEFIFEKKFFSEGQSNVVLQVDKIRQWADVKIPLTRVDKEVLREMARFCISISESTSKSPSSATMEIRQGIVKNR